MRRLVIICSILFFSILLHSEKISLEQSIEIAKQNNKELLSENSALQSAGWMQKNAFTNFLPKLSFNSTAIRIDNDTYETANQMMELPVILNGQQMMIEIPAAAMSGGIYKTTFMNNIIVQQPIFNGGKVLIGYQLANLARKQAVNSLQNKENDIIFQVAATYFNLLKLYDLQELAEKSLNSSNSHLQNIEKKYEVGIGQRSDVLQWQVKVKNDQTSKNEISNNIMIMESIWKNLLGMDEVMKLPEKIQVGDFNPEIIEYADLDPENIRQKLDHYLSRVKSDNPNLKTLELSKKMMKKNYLMAKGNFLPSLNLQFTYEIERDDKFDLSGNDNWNLAAMMSFPLFSSGANYTNLRKSKYEMKQTDLMTESVKDNLLTGAETTFYTLLTKAQSCENNKSALELAQKNHQIINDLFEQGMVTNTELIDADILLFSSEMNLISSVYDFILSKYEMKKWTN
ncbi:MAG: TolC family protein [Candidatus Cloacimonetes bacterium]|nr:TolC family protein [Candidatus Cloacimonadota bacterium]